MAPVPAVADGNVQSVPDGFLKQGLLRKRNCQQNIPELQTIPGGAVMKEDCKKSQTWHNARSITQSGNTKLIHISPSVSFFWKLRYSVGERPVRRRNSLAK